MLLLSLWLLLDSLGNDKAQVEGELPPDLSDVPKCVIRDVPDEAYYDGRVAKLAVEALEELAAKETGNQPWFLGVGFWKPHSHFNAPKRYWDLYDRSKIGPADNPKPPKLVPPIALHDGRGYVMSNTSSAVDILDLGTRQRVAQIPAKALLALS